ncbi:hypothetical protein AB0E96_19155 [Kitasatospora sp. NPDC036755]
MGEKPRDARHRPPVTTASYHLQMLHRAGLVSRTRRSRHVLYQRLGGAV